MAKFIIFFFVSMGAAVSYLTYTGTGQESIETLETESARSNSYRGSHSSFYNSSSYGYGK